MSYLDQIVMTIVTFGSTRRGVDKRHRLETVFPKAVINTPLKMFLGLAFENASLLRKDFRQMN